MNKLLTTQELNSLQAESILKKIKSTFKDAEKVGGFIINSSKVQIPTGI